MNHSERIESIRERLRAAEVFKSRDKAVLNLNQLSKYVEARQAIQENAPADLEYLLTALGVAVEVMKDASRGHDGRCSYTDMGCIQCALLEALQKIEGLAL